MDNKKAYTTNRIKVVLFREVYNEIRTCGKAKIEVINEGLKGEFAIIKQIPKNFVFAVDSGGRKWVPKNTPTNHNKISHIALVAEGDYYAT